MMNIHAKLILEKIGIPNLSQEHFILRDELLSDLLYDDIKKLLPELKKNFSSSTMTCLQNNAEKEQRWPLINLTRQILSYYNVDMKPVRKSDGYTLEGVKKYKRFFHIKPRNKKTNHSNTANTEEVSEVNE